jgi:multicomponent Na+:H+ antiporter subunit E
MIRSIVGSEKVRGFLSLWILLTFIWIAANTSFAAASVATGVLIAAALAYVVVSKTEVWKDVRVTPTSLYHFILYTGVFVVELVRANMNMLRYVYSPRIAIAPGIVRIKTRLRSRVGRLALANSIALTPGSLVMDIKGDTLFIHWLDVKTTDTDEATRLIAEPFEEHLEKVFG